MNVHEEYVLRGNAAVLKCAIPSFVSDFVVVSAWIIDEQEILANTAGYGTYTTSVIPPRSFPEVVRFRGLSICFWL